MSAMTAPGHWGVGHTITVATYNCCSLTGKLKQILIKMDELNIDCMALQETRVTAESRRAVFEAAQAWGYRLIFSDCAYDKKGAITGGLAYISE